MPDYRIYKTTKEHRIDGIPTEIVCDNDTDAVEQARKMSEGLDIEIWNGPRLVTQLKAAERR